MKKNKETFINELIKELKVPYQLNVKISGEIVDLVLPSRTRALIIAKIIEPMDKREWNLITGVNRDIEEILRIDEFFERVKNSPRPLVCTCIVMKMSKYIEEILSKVNYVDEILWGSPKAIANRLNKIATTPWYPTFIISRLRDREILGLAPLGRYIKEDKVYLEPNARGFIGIEPLTGKVYVSNFSAIIKMILNINEISIDRIKVKEIEELVKDIDEEIIVRWSKENPEEAKLLVNELKQRGKKLSIVSELINLLDSLDL